MNIFDWMHSIVPKIITEFGLVIRKPITLSYLDKLGNPVWLGSCEFKKEDDRFYIKINAKLINKNDIAFVLLHELLHAHCYGIGCYGHEGEFRKLSEKFGFKGHPTQNTAKQSLLNRLEPIIKGE